ncbi:hypothetical protein NQ314_013447 [Rhamnusium bicolor]|uniref:Uncharacterized protein n=1 Tax=Rhamnusium bicolor TaxID=1586634 RepID=A0AAV8X675_9CUCU|nr:hypothetical protein NQ314_013447 [Rhamnusium bicolor]
MDLIREKSLRINTTSAEVLNKLCSTTCNDADVTEKIRDHIDALSDFQLKPKPELARIPHPVSNCIR